MAEHTLKEMTQAVVDNIKQHSKTGTKPWTYEVATKDLACQLGVLTKLMMQYDGERFAHGDTKEEIKSKVADELADILSLVLFISHEMGIDIERAHNAAIFADKRKIDARLR